MFDRRPASPLVRVAGVAPRMFGAPSAKAAGCNLLNGGAKLPTAIGPDSTETLLPGESVTLTFTPYSAMEGLRFWLTPAIAQLCDVTFLGNQGCNNQAGSESVPGEVYARTNEGDYGCAVTRVRCVSSDRPLEVRITGRASVPAEGVEIDAAMIGYNVDGNENIQGAVQGNRVAACYDSANVPTREAVLGSTEVTLTDASPTGILTFTPYASYEGSRLFIDEAHGVNVRVSNIEHVGCNLMAGAGPIQGLMFSGSSASDFCYPLLTTGCIDSTQPLKVTVTKFQGPASISFRAALIGKDKRPVACG